MALEIGGGQPRIENFFCPHSNTVRSIPSAGGQIAICGSAGNTVIAGAAKEQTSEAGTSLQTQTLTIRDLRGFGEYRYRSVDCLHLPRIG
jgi:hypothetical protein